MRNGSSYNNGDGETLPADVRELLDTSVETIDALDALLLLSRDASRSWGVAEVAAAIDIDEGSARTALADLHSRGLASDVVGRGDVFRIAPLAPLSLRAFAALSSACAVDRGAVVEYIARRSMGRLKVLAQAFTRGRTPP